VVGAHALERDAQPGRAAMAAMAVEHVVDRAQVEDLQLLAALERSGRVVERHAGREVEVRARERRDPDAVNSGDVLDGEPALVDRDARQLAAARGGDGDVPAGPVVGPHAVHARGGAVGEHGAGPAGEHGGHAATLDAQRVVPDRVHAAMQPDEQTAFDEPGDLRVGEAQRGKLAPGDDAVLTGGQRSHHPFGVSCALCPRGGHTAQLAARGPGGSAGLRRGEVERHCSSLAGEM